MSQKPLVAIAFIAVVILSLAGCSGSAARTAPTPFPTAGTLENTPNADPMTLSLSELTGALGRYEDATVIVSGRLRRQPLLVCDSDPNPSPATWSLTEDGTVLLASQFDQQVRQLLPEDVTMTVEGRLRRWEGPVGCGKQAQTQEVWYLEASRILAPSPLTQATLTPGALAMGGDDADIEVTPVVDEGQPTPAVIVTEPSPESADPTSPPTEAVATEPAQQPTETPDISATAAQTPLPLTVITATAAISSTTTVTPTPSATPGPGTPTVTPDISGGTATVPATTGPERLVDKGYVDDIEEEFPAGTLGSGETHSWTVEIFEEDIYDVQVIAPVPADIILSLYRDGQPVINRQNRSPSGMAEIMEISDQPEGVYEIRIQTENGQPAEYIMVLSIPGDLEVNLLGFVAPGAPRSNVTLPETTSHYWNFTAAAGNTVTITVTPEGQGDAYIYLFGPGGVFITDLDDEGEGTAEVLEYTVETSGMHTIVVEDLSSDEMVYSLLLTTQP